MISFPWVTIHLLREVPPSKLNADDTGAPKTGQVGAVLRAAWSSQAQKAAMRSFFRSAQLLDPAELAVRTKYTVDLVAASVRCSGQDSGRVKAAVAKALAGGRLKVLPDWKTEYLLFLPRRAVQAIADVVSDHLLDLLALVPSSAEVPPSDEGEADEANKPEKPEKSAVKGVRRAAKTTARAEVPAEVQREITAILEDNRHTPEIALFGSMVADAPERSVRAAAQVAYAFTTHRAELFWDYFTARSDDEPGREQHGAGADMTGTIPFTSGCFLQVLHLDLRQLYRNLGEDEPGLEQARRTMRAFLRAAIEALPSGKQNSMAAHCLPSFVLVEVRAGQPRQYSNAFDQPVHPRTGEHGGLIAQSTLALARGIASMDKAYGAGRKELAFVLVEPEEAGNLSKAFVELVPTALQRENILALVEGAVAAAFGDKT
jgi:CRISPR system Cascade subunit CasC